MVVGICMCKDEADVIGRTVSLMAGQVDHIVVADNGSTDGTGEILDRLAQDLPLTVLDDPEPGYYQSRKMTALALDAARGLSADWVIPFDSDERWYSPFGRIADVLAEQDTAAVATAELYDHVATAEDPDDPDPVSRIQWRRREPAPLPKVACRPLAPVTIHQGNHGASHGTRIDGLLVVRHFPYRSAEQMIRKARNGAAAYAATDLPDHQGAHWRQYGQLSDDQLADVFREHFWSRHPERDRSLIFDPCPT